ncbi:hypothetical protein KX816_05335 [Sphingosinicellaceae bacterium]|nr:hypothetical protein KX816_05335 [Sphingosinicellaceae bacterium]
MPVSAGTQEIGESMSNHAHALATTLRDSGLVGDLEVRLKVIESSKLRIIEAVIDVIKSLDEGKRESWRSIILAAGEGGVTDDQLHRELGASMSTIHRWRNDDVAPREGTRRLMKRAIVELAEARIKEFAD